jgi:hypothetical protein
MDIWIDGGRIMDMCSKCSMEQSSGWVRDRRSYLCQQQKLNTWKQRSNMATKVVFRNQV